jgi:hypothetical protein
LELQYALSLHRAGLCPLNRPLATGDPKVIDSGMQAAFRALGGKGSAVPAPLSAILTA